MSDQPGVELAGSVLQLVINGKTVDQWEISVTTFGMTYGRAHELFDAITKVAHEQDEEVICSMGPYDGAMHNYDAGASRTGSFMESRNWTREPTVGELGLCHPLQLTADDYPEDQGLSKT